MIHYPGARCLGRRHRLTAIRWPLLVACMDRGENNDQFINHTIVEAVLAVWIDDVRPAA